MSSSFPAPEGRGGQRLPCSTDRGLLMDTVGMEQLDLPDHEACFPSELVDPDEVAGMLRNLQCYVVSTGNEIEPGDTGDGPGGRWQAHHSAEALVSPPRPAIRWLPLHGRSAPDALLPTSSKA